jgi:hypothetical protein
LKPKEKKLCNYIDFQRSTCLSTELELTEEKKDWNLGTVPATATSETLESDVEEEHRRNKQISSAAKLLAANPFELKEQTALTAASKSSGRVSMTKMTKIIQKDHSFVRSFIHQRQIHKQTNTLLFLYIGYMLRDKMN